MDANKPQRPSLLTVIDIIESLQQEELGLSAHPVQAMYLANVVAARSGK
jgi:hypothetical protein